MDIDADYMHKLNRAQSLVAWLVNSIAPQATVSLSGADYYHLYFFVTGSNGRLSSDLANAIASRDNIKIVEDVSEEGFVRVKFSFGLI